jgi:hypothetical protein
MRLLIVKDWLGSRQLRELIGERGGIRWGLDLRLPDMYLDKRMQVVLDRLGVALVVVWKPDSSASVHGEIRGNAVFVYDEDEEEAWATFVHEVVEFKLQKLTRVYRTMANCLIEGYEKLAYQEKEDFIECMPRLFQAANFSGKKAVPQKEKH